MRAKRDETLSTAMLNQCSICLAASVLYRNWQRPGAVVNATVQEFETCKLMSRNEKASVYIMSVKEHKTAQEGYARLVLEGIDYARIVQYADSVRKCLNPNGGSDKLFLLSGGRSINSGKSYGLVLPSATRVRKIGATSVALRLGDLSKAHLVTRHQTSLALCSYRESVLPSHCRQPACRGGV